ncbi:MAG: precorrin-6A/cobalt-precorrin-6A reductase [Lachnospiraceae bacterium]
MREASESASPLVFICAAGIAVRLIAPWVKDKMSDGPVIVIDPGGRFVVPILSGHAGGANALARRLAGYLGAEAVLTTATDSGGRFAADSFAREHGCAISDRKKVKEIAVKSLEGQKIRVFSDPESGAGIRPGGASGTVLTSDVSQADVVISAKKLSMQALQLIPKRLIVGVGCRKGASKEEIQEAVSRTLGGSGYDLRSVAAIASIDLKKDEAGIVQTAAEMRVPFLTFPAETLSHVQGSVSPSDFVKQVTGVDNVCERSALAVGSRLVIRKSVCSRVTVAAAMADFKILLFGGTTEGKELTEFLEKQAISALVLTATGYGAQVLPGDMKYVRVLTGRLTAGRMADLFLATCPRAVIDATHPYAEEVSANIRAAAGKTGVKLIRVKRPETAEIPGAAYFASPRDAAMFLNRTAGNILLTTGVKDLPVFMANVRDAGARVFARVLSHSKSAAAGAGVREDHILAGEGPFSTEENERAIRDTKAAFLVSKDSGEAGGLPEKVRAAAGCGCALLIIRRPGEPEDAVSAKQCEEAILELSDT